MAEPINLNKARKARAAADAKAVAAENRVRFGRTKAEKDVAKARVDKAARDHAAMKRED
jgi:hypothetical protein